MSKAPTTPHTDDAPRATRRVAWFVTPHGYGHAARACAIMAALHARAPHFHFDIFTRVPRHFFRDSLGTCFTYHELLTDIGLVQDGPMLEDLQRTVDALDAFAPFDTQRLDSLASLLHRLGCEAVVADIAPLGLAAAAQAGLPSILVENFTWDWIYDNYADAPAGLHRHARYFEALFAAADLHIQTAPVSAPRPGCPTTSPVARPFRESRATLRARLGIPADARVVLLSMGGIPARYVFDAPLSSRPETVFVVAGGQGAPSREGNVLVLPHDCGVYHPDLVRAADVVVGKAGYSTIAEVYRAGLPFAYMTRPRFKESEALARFATENIPGLRLTEASFRGGEWVSDVMSLASRPARERTDANGAETAADGILGFLAGR